MTSILLSAGLALPATANTVARHHFPHMPGFAMRFGSRFAEPVAKPRAGKTTDAKTQKPVRVDSGSYIIVDHPDADASWGTRLVGINEHSAGSGYYLNKNDGAFHGFLRIGNDFPIDIQVGSNDTFEALMNDKNETFGSYIDNDDGLEKAWVRTKNGAVIPFEIPDATNGSIGQFINNNGVLVGAYIDGNGAYHCFSRTRAGVVGELSDAPNAGSGEEQGTECIGNNNQNETGDIAGGVVDGNYHAIAFLRHVEDGSYEEFEAPKAGSGENQGTFAAEVDDQGRVYGQVIDSHDVMHGYIREKNGKFRLVNAPDAGTGPGQGTVSVEHCEGGWCVGEYIDSNDVSHGYYCTDYCKKQGEIVEFDPPGVGDAGTYVVISSNKAHQITGTFKDANGIRHGFVRDPN
jgi:hypothetical protein